MAKFLTFKNQARFELRLKEFAKKTVPAEVLKLTKLIALGLLRNIVQRTPVGNPSFWKTPAPPGYVGGRARGNWQVSLNIAGESESGLIDPTGGAALGLGSSEIGKAFPFQRIVIFNNVKYIVPLEHGWSAQAPAGMVALSVAEAEAFADRLGEL